MGCMRLSTEPGRDEARAIATLHAALDAGVTLLDTADAYGIDAADAGHNERLIARALATWPGDRARIAVATKGGLTRPAGAWVADGRARHLRAACQASCRALGVERLDLYQLHAPDPRTSFATSVRALAGLARDGLVQAIGLSNVRVGQIEEARRIAEIAAVQVELSLWQDANIQNGVVPYCLAHGIRLLAYRPLGGLRHGHRLSADPILADIAERHDATPAEIALAWLAGLSDLIVPLPGATRPESARSIGRARDISLSARDQTVLEERFPAGMAWRRRARAPGRRATAVPKGEIVLVMGLPAAGKSTIARNLAAEGYHRLNRDETGGSLSDLVPRLDRLIASGTTRLVLDNTYMSRRARAEVIDAGRAHDVPVRCIWLATGIEDSQVNAASRMVASYGRLLSPDEMRRTAKRDPSVFPPGVQFRYQRELEPPDRSEGFASIEVRAFERQADPLFTERAAIVWCDGVLMRSRSGRRVPASAADVEVLPGYGDILRRYRDERWLLLGLSWQPEVEQGGSSVEAVAATLARAQELLGVSIEVEYCPHAAGPPACWCRKPLPGLGALFVRRHRLDPSRCLYVGTGAQDPGFARRLGFQYQDARVFFSRVG
jgi:aryl-alcohol dehydrogenase-like predicted oxidoreductase/histidinol phosphatase-like enzyme/predicted kinase